MNFRRILCAVLLVLPITACDGARAVGTSDSNRIAYEKYGIIRFKVGEIQIEDFQPSYQPPHVEHLMYLTPYAALHNWAQNRFQAVGNMGLARVEILDASVTQKNIPVYQDNLLGGRVVQGTELNLRLQVKIEVDAPAYYELPYAQAVVTRKFTFTEQTTIADRETMMKNALADAIDQLDAVMTKTLHDKWRNIIQ